MKKSLSLGLLALLLLGGLLWILFPRRALLTGPAVAAAPAPTAATVSAASPAAPVTAAKSAASTAATPAAAAVPASVPPPIAPLPPAVAPADPAFLAALPAGVFRDQLQKLAPAAQARALARLARHPVPRQDYASLRVVPTGDVYYVCDLIPPPSGPLASLPAIAAGAVPGTQAAPVPISNPPVRHSRPGATKVLYLDFNGQTITGTSWNSSEGVTTYVAKPYDTDGSPTTFSDAEQAIILDVWARVAEDYAPFDVDVTTEEPAVFTPTTGWALITENFDANAVALPSHTAGGVAFLGVFGESSYPTSTSPAFAYFNQLGSTSGGNIAEAVAHELGHNLGLSHDGRVDDPGTVPDETSEYYGGHGSGETSWGPIMGTGYGRNVSQWSKGEYYVASNTQDDFAILAGNLAYRTDEAGATLATTAVAGVTGGTLSSTGVIASVTDLDLFAVNTTAGSVSLTVALPVAATGTRGGNGDVKLEVLDAAGTVVASADPTATTGGSLTYGSPGGLLYVRLSAAATGDPFTTSPTGYTSYGSAGQYTLTGSLPAAAPALVGATTLNAPAGALFSYQIPATNGPTSYSATSLPPGLTVDTSTGIISGRPTATGLFNVTLGATNASGSGSGGLALTITDAAPAISAQTAGRQSVAIKGSLTLSVTAVSANGTPTYQWRRNGVIIAGATAATLPLSSVTMTSAGTYRAYVTNTIGTTVSAPVFVQVVPLASGVTGWGSNSLGQTTVPGGLTDAIALAAGGSHTLALKADGTVVAWGDNSSGQSTVPAGLTDVVAIAASSIPQGASPSYSYQEKYSMALKADGTVVAWGAGAFGQADIPAGLTDVVAIAAGFYHALALKADGTVVAWGNNSFTQTDVPVGLTDVVGIAAGRIHSVARKADGTVVAWGDNGNGETNVSGGLINVVDVAAGGFHSLALKSDGTVSNWGLGFYGTPPGGFNTGRRIVAGYNHVVALKSDATVTAWGGSNTDGQNTVPGGLTNTFEVAASAYSSFALRETTVPALPVFSTHPATQTVLVGGNVTLTVAVTGTPTPTLQWQKDGSPLSGQTGTSLTLNAVTAGDAGSYTVVATNSSGAVTSNAGVLTIDAAPVVAVQTAVRSVIAAGGGFTHTVTATGGAPITYQWYRNNRPLGGATAATYAVGTATAADAGAYHVVATNASGSRRSPPFFVLVAPTDTALTVWGDTASGQGTIPGGLTDAVAVSAGTSHILALKRDGTVVAWGANTNGQTNVPGGLTGVVAIFAGQQHSLALKSDGTVVAWGWNASGQANVPGGLSGVIAVAGGDFHSYALKTDGTITAWGNNGAGQLNIPGGLASASILGTGASHALVIKTDDTVVAWGNNGSSQATVPGGLTGVVAVEGGNFHSLAAKSDGTVVAWGSNTSGQATVPGGLTGVTTVAAGGTHSLALLSDGTVTGWGANANNQTTIPGGLARIIALTAGGNTSVALRDTTLAAQTITFGSLADTPFTPAPLTLSATASSGLTVTFAVVSGPATVSGNSLTLTGTGAVTVRASQAGNASFAAAADVDRSFNVTASFASWLQGKFTAGELLDASTSGPNADPDADGLVNLTEYALGLEPKTVSTASLPVMGTTASDWVYTYARPDSVTDLTYSVEVSTNLSTWGTGGVTHELVSSSGGIETWQARYPLASATNVFFRLKVVR